MAIGRENFFWHKLHSLSGVIPVGFYMVQHLTLNSFSLAGPDAFNGVIAFFEGMPKHFKLGLEAISIWIPLLFHAVYGFFITSRAEPNYGQYRFIENRYYLLQRVSGVLAFLFLCYHVASTTIAAQFQGVGVIQYAAWSEKLSSTGYLWLFVYLLGVLACTYHFSFGIWSFCIRWGLTISPRAQRSMFRVSAGTCVLLTLLGWAALGGFLRNPSRQVEIESPKPTISQSPDRATL